MGTNTINEALARGDHEQDGVLPHLEDLKEAKFVFEMDFGLDTLPVSPGILLIRGARQYGKSTWLEQQIANTIKEFGPGSAYYLNGEYILTIDRLEQELDMLVNAFEKKSKVNRIFIDEITAIDRWEIAIKRMADRRIFKNVLLVTTGSSATDIRRGTEKLPGRKSKLERSDYLFTPISYREFIRVCGHKLTSDPILTYLLSGGSPIACSELATHGRIPEYVIEIVRNWVDGEVARAGRSRSSLFNIMSVLHNKAATPIGQAKLAREAGLSNNTVAQGYIELLSDLGCVLPAYPWDQNKKISIKRKECKYHFTNLLVALVYHPARIRSVDDFLTLSDQEQGNWLEWLVAQELLRRQSISGESLLEPLAFWQKKAKSKHEKERELDFVDSENNFLEVKRGKASALEFAWFSKHFPNNTLSVVSKSSFETNSVVGSTFEAYLLSE